MGQGVDGRGGAAVDGIASGTVGSASGEVHALSLEREEKTMRSQVAVDACI